MVDATCIWPFSVMNQIAEPVNLSKTSGYEVRENSIAEFPKFISKLSKVSTLAGYISPRSRANCVGFPITLIKILLYHKRSCRKDLPVGGKLIAAGSPYTHFCDDRKHKF